MTKTARTTKQLIEDVAEARMDLNHYYAIIALCESSLFSSECHPDETKIIRLCRSGAQRALERVDEAAAQILKRSKP